MSVAPRLSPEFLDDGRTDDLVQPFQIDRFGLRGRLVRLGETVDTVLGRHDYPDSVARLLGEALALAACLASSVKYEGVFTLQAKGNGPVSLLVADVTSDGALRGYAGFDAAAVAALETRPSAPTVARLFGGGYVAFTVDQGSKAQRYQGIVELQGATLAECVHHYFQQSEQIDTAIKLACERAGAAWRAGALMVQRLPEQRETDQPELDVEGEWGEGSEEGWHRAVLFMSTATAAEMIDPRLTPRELLFRLFHEDGVRVFRPRFLEERCRCGRGRVEKVLVSLPRAEIESLKEDDPELVVTCEFCNRSERFSADELDRLYAPVGDGASGRGAAAD